MRAMCEIKDWRAKAIFFVLPVIFFAQSSCKKNTRREEAYKIMIVSNITLIFFHCICSRQSFFYFMEKSAFILIFFVIVCFGCSQNRQGNLRFSEEQIAQLGLNNIQPLNILNENSLKIDLSDFLSDKETPISEFVESMIYIPLQTTKESLIGEIRKIIYLDNYVFIFDPYISKTVFIFSNDGIFIKKIPIGQGPQDIFRPIDFAVDEQQEHLIIYNSYRLSFYDYQGNFVKRESLPFNFHNFRVLPNGYLFVSVANIYNIHLEAASEMQVIITDKNFRIISVGFPFHYSKSLNYSITDYTSSFGNDVNFAFKFSDKIYRYVDTLTIIEDYHLDFARKGLPSRYLEMSWDDVQKALNSTSYYFFMGDYVENSTHESFQIKNLSKKSPLTVVFRDKTSGKLKGGSNFIDDGKIFMFTAPFTSYKDEFIGAFDAYNIYLSLLELKKDEKNKAAFDRLNALFGYLEEDANPILVKYKLKNFN